MLIAGVPNLFLVAMLSLHSKGDEAIRYACWYGAAHLWDDQKCKEVLCGSYKLQKVCCLKKDIIENIEKMQMQAGRLVSLWQIL